MVASTLRALKEELIVDHLRQGFGGQRIEQLARLLQRSLRTDSGCSDTKAGSVVNAPDDYRDCQLSTIFQLSIFLINWHIHFIRVNVVDQDERNEQAGEQSFECYNE